MNIDQLSQVASDVFNEVDDAEVLDKAIEVRNANDALTKVGVLTDLYYDSDTKTVVALVKLQ